MKVSHFGGIVDCETINSMLSILNLRYGKGVNEFWIYGEDRFPCLAILVNNDYANLTYFPEDGHPGFQSIAMDTDLNMKDISIFYTNTPDEEIEIDNDAIVPFSRAVEATKEFFTSLSLPTCLKWLELCE